MTTKIQLIHNKIAITFPYNPNLVKKCQALPERKFNKKWRGLDNVWVAPTRLASEIVENFENADIDPEVENLANKTKKLASISSLSDSDFDVPLAFGELKNYQRAGVQFLNTSNGRGIIADEMGLGKTLQSIAYLMHNPDVRPAIVVVPASLKINWQREFLKFGNIESHVISGGKTYDVSDHSVIIINYDIVTKWLDELLKLNPQILIADEAHYVKNPKSLRSKAIKKLAKTCPQTILLTGTPVMNRPKELWPLLNLVDSGAWSAFFPFAKRYCDAQDNGWGWDFNGASNLEELYQVTRPYIVRRLKKDVLTELPAKQRVTIPIEMTRKGRSEYVKLLREAREKVYDSETAHLVMIEKAKQAAVSAKLPQAMKWIADFLESGEKLIVFCTHKFVVDTLMEEFPDMSVKLTGDVSPEGRQSAVDAFQCNDDTKLFIGNIKAAGVGLTLTAASNVAFIEFGWTPGEHLQAEDRAHRIGQKDSVTAWYLPAIGTIEENIVSMIDHKSLVVDSVTDGTTENSLSLSMYQELKSLV